jgi:acylphosphatase
MARGQKLSAIRMHKTLHLSITGRVQGVGYRDSLRAQAVRVGCTGWVRNRKDGSVEAHVSGEGEAVDQVVAWAHRGPPAALVEEVKVSEVPGRYAQFEVLRTT